MIKPFIDIKIEEWKGKEIFKKSENIFYGAGFIVFLFITGLFAFPEKNEDKPFIGQIHRARTDTKTVFSMSALKDVHNYLLEHAAEGDIVFTDDWDVFPKYFFANTKTYYIVGLDPEFMNLFDGWPYKGQKGMLYREFASISSGKDGTNLKRIKEHFKAKWIIVNTDHMKFYRNLKKEPHLFKEVLFARNNKKIDKYPKALKDGYYLFRVL